MTEKVTRASVEDQIAGIDESLKHLEEELALLRLQEKAFVTSTNILTNAQIAEFNECTRLLETRRTTKYNLLKQKNALQVNLQSLE